MESQLRRPLLLKSKAVGLSACAQKGRTDSYFRPNGTISILSVMRVGAIAVVLGATLATSLGAQTASTYEQYVEAAWADGKIDAAERAQFRIYDEQGSLQAAKEYATELFDPKDIEVHGEPERRVDIRSWVPMTAAKANREVEVHARKARWYHSAIVDYDGDGTQETARLTYYGNQMAVIVEFTKPRPRKMVVFQTSLHPDVEIFGAGKRIMTNWPDLGHRILLMHNGKPSVVYIGD